MADAASLPPAHKPHPARIWARRRVELDDGGGRRAGLRWIGGETGGRLGDCRWSADLPKGGPHALHRGVASADGHSPLETV